MPGELLAVPSIFHRAFASAPTSFEGTLVGVFRASVGCLAASRIVLILALNRTNCVAVEQSLDEPTTISNLLFHILVCSITGRFPITELSMVAILLCRDLSVGHVT